MIYEKENPTSQFEKWGLNSAHGYLQRLSGGYFNSVFQGGNKRGNIIFPSMN
jgi:hypothetical protein